MAGVVEIHQVALFGILFDIIQLPLNIVSRGPAVLRLDRLVSPRWTGCSQNSDIFRWYAGFK